MMALSVVTAKANTKLAEKDLIAEVARLNTRVEEREQAGRDHATEIDETPKPDLDTLTKVRQALAKEYRKLKTAWPPA